MTKFKWEKLFVELLKTNIDSLRWGVYTPFPNFKWN